MIRTYEARLRLCTLVMPLALGALARAQESDASSTSPLVPGAEARRLATGFEFTEGPVWVPAGYLLFSDTRANRILRWAPDAEVGVFLEPSGRANGLALDLQGRLVACQAEARGLASIDLETRALVPLVGSYDGKKLNSPNDLVVDEHGGVWFTDPRYGGGEPLEQEVMGVYYRSAAGELKRVISDLPRPNGICLAPGGEWLYVANPDRREIVRYPVEGPGAIGAGSVWFTGEAEQDGIGPDGISADVEGNVYATYASLVVLSARGEVLQRLALSEKPSNCAFGGAEGKTLFVTARTSLYAVEGRVRGAEYRAPTIELDLGSLSLQVPTSWRFSEPSSDMRLGQIAVPGPGGEAELVIYYFGQGGAGGVRANIERWIGQFVAEGRTTRIAKGECPNGAYAVVTCTGTYNQPVGPPIRREFRPMPAAAMIALIVPTSKGDHFLKLTGPEATVLAAARELRAAIGAGGEERAVNLNDLAP